MEPPDHPGLDLKFTRSAKNSSAKREHKQLSDGEQDNSSTEQFVDRFWDNSSTLCETTRQHRYSKLIDQ